MRKSRSAHDDEEIGHNDIDGAIFLLLSLVATFGIAGNGLFNDGKVGLLLVASLALLVTGAGGVVLTIGKARKAFFDSERALERESESSKNDKTAG